LTTISWRINAERIVLLGWSRAILMQLAHPMVAAGVDEHSAFRGGPMAAASRLHQTVRAMLSLTFGDRDAQAATIERIRAIHRRVNGRLVEAGGGFAAGTPYSAEDPRLLLWVHATLVDTIPFVYERLVAPLSEAEHDAYCEEAAPVAVALGAEERDVPRTRAGIRAYVADMLASPEIEVGTQARELARAVLAPPMAAVIAPVTWTNRLVTAGLLPAALRAQYGFTWSPRSARQLERVLDAIAWGRRLTPALLAQWPEARRTL
jgi:uncharacterized protein (DUF2236 family)